jgi:hypothetical protein
MTEPTTSKPNKKPTIPTTETEEYKALLHDNAVLQDRITELEDLVRKLMVVEGSPLGFQNAKDIALSPIDSLAAVKAANTETGNLVIEPALSPITFPSTQLAKFFIASRNCKDNMILSLDKDGKVIDWRVE